MPVTFNQCPSCKSMILPDTPVCPTCKHVFQGDGSLLEENTTPAITLEEQDEEIECASCGEMVRSGLVRCWNCGGFMREDIAAAYRAMKSRPPEVIYSPESLQNLRENEADLEAYDFEEQDDEGFELATGVSSSASFKLPPSQTTPAQPITLPSQPASSTEIAVQEPVEEELIPAEEATIPLVESEAQVEAVEQPVSESAPAPESSEDASAAKTSPKQKEKGDEESVAHSEATGADVLLNIALEEERETGRRKLQNLLPGMFIVYCPKGHRIKVREKHRGLTGKCPVCKAAFHVPAEEPKSDSEEAAGEESKLEEGSTDDKTIVTGSYSGWMQDVSQHRVDPARLKLRPGSLVKEFTPVDLAFSADGLLICELSKPGALFGGGPKKNPAIREEIYEHLRQGLSIDKLPGHKHRFFSTENFSELRIVQPCPAGQISLFHDIPVFGEGRIAIQIPRMDEGNELEFLSFSLSQFRSFVAGMRTVCGQADFAADAGIPLEENYELFKCHYTQQQVPALNQMDYYKADKSFELITVGYQCEKCGLVMSEEGRAAEKFGGAKGKSIAKAKCPGCEQKFGSMILEAIKDDPILAPEPENEEAEDETATAGEETSMEEVTPSEGASAESETEAKSEK